MRYYDVNVSGITEEKSLVAAVDAKLRTTAQVVYSSGRLELPRCGRGRCSLYTYTA